MGYKGFLSGIIAGTVVSGIALFVVIMNLSPEQGLLSLSAFFTSIFVLLIGLLTITGFYGRKIIFGNEVLYSNIKVAFRQAFLLSFFITILLVLNSYQILVLWDAILLFFSIMLLEFYFRTKIY